MGYDYSCCCSSLWIYHTRAYSKYGVQKNKSSVKIIAGIVFKELDPILHSQLRLAVMSLLISVKEAEFTFIKEKTNATAGNLSVQIQKLKEVGYIEVAKEFKDNYPNTTCKITRKGIAAFEEYVKALQQYLNVNHK